MDMWLGDHGRTESLGCNTACSHATVFKHRSSTHVGHSAVRNACMRAGMPYSSLLLHAPAVGYPCSLCASQASYMMFTSWAKYPIHVVLSISS